MTEMGQPGLEARPAGDALESGNGRIEQSLITRYFPENATLVMGLALALGLLLLVFGFVARVMWPALWIQDNVVLALGVGLILAAFGGRARYEAGPFVLVGVAAVVAFFLLYLQYLDGRPREGFLIGEVIGISARDFDVSIDSRRDAIGGFEGQRFRFYFDDSDTEAVDLSLIGKENNLNSYCLKINNPTCEIAFRIPSSFLLDAISNRTSVYWRVDTANMRLLTKDGQLIRDYLAEDNTSDTAQVDNPAWNPFAIEAFAQEPLEVPVTGEGSVRTTDELLANLESDDTTIRRLARDALAAGDSATFPLIIDHFVASETYRGRLGSVVAITEMLRRDNSQAADFRGVLKPADLQAIVEASADPDRTIRIYASEFLYDLGDPRSVALALQRAGQSSGDPNAVYNLVFAASGAIGALPAEEQASAITSLKALETGPNTQILIDDVIARIQSGS